MLIDQSFLERIISVLSESDKVWFTVASFPDDLRTDPEKLLLHLTHLTDSHQLLLEKNSIGKDQVRLTPQGHALAEGICNQQLRDQAIKNISKVLQPHSFDEDKAFRYADIDVVFK